MPLETVDQSPVDPAFVQNPYPFYSRLRAMGDFVVWRDYGLPVATTHEAVMAVLKHRDLGREIPEGAQEPPRPELAPFYAVEAHSMLEREPPVHTRLRGLVLKAFTRRRIYHLALEISAICDQLIADFPDGEFDLLTAFAQQVPVLVIARLLGVPAEMAPQLLDWSNRIVAMYQARRTPEIENDAAAAADEFTQFLRTYVETRRTAPQDDLISHLIAAEENGEHLSTDELISTCILLLNAGHEATVHSLGNAIVHLNDFDGRAETLLPENIEGTVEECLRFDPPLHMFTRHVYRPVSIMGQHFKEGDEIGCLLGSACRDDAVWPDGEVFDPFRPARQHAAFGAGIHFCVGAPLARLEMQIALPILYASCPSLRIVVPPKVANLYHFRGREKLMVRR